MILNENHPKDKSRHTEMLQQLPAWPGQAEHSCWKCGISLSHKTTVGSRGRYTNQGAEQDPSMSSLWLQCWGEGRGRGGEAVLLAGLNVQAK